MYNLSLHIGKITIKDYDCGFRVTRIRTVVKHFISRCNLWRQDQASKCGEKKSNRKVLRLRFRITICHIGKRRGSLIWNKIASCRDVSFLVRLKESPQTIPIAVKLVAVESLQRFSGVSFRRQEMSPVGDTSATLVKPFVFRYDQS